jgi:glyoxylase-like metal-dependent hydrolase (beta-lactamase superfamily II)
LFPTDLAHVRQYFGFSDWPNGLAQLDLGNRIIDVIPTPGHYPSHVSYYDRQTGLFFSGDFFLPGRLIIDDAQADLGSANRVADFIRNRPVTYVLGGPHRTQRRGRATPPRFSLPSPRARPPVNPAGPSRLARNCAQFQRLLHSEWHLRPL